MLALATELRRRGHDCCFAGPGLFRMVLEPLGFEAHAIAPDLDPNDKELIADLMDLRRGSERLLKQVLFPALPEGSGCAGKPAADLLISNDITYAAPIVAELTGVRWASLILAPFTFFSRYDPPALPPFPGLAWVESKVPTVNRGILPFARWYSRKWVRPVYDLRRSLGLARGKNPIFDAKNSPQLVLGLFSSLLGEPQPDWPAVTRLCGFTFYDGKQPTAEAAEAGLPAHVEEFLQMGPAPVVFTLGSSAVFAAGDFYQTSAEACARLGLRAILLTGVLPDGQPRGILSKDLCTAEYVSYGELFPRVAAIVHQGGVGTLAHALKAGKPMIIMPCSHDQPDNARRAVRLGVARTIPREKYTATRAAQELQALLLNPGTAAGYAAVGRLAARHLAEENGTAMACNELEQLMEKRAAV
jgi:UDP:flavonoid glycosyltransferase YjiC (YdhE family)